MQAHNDPLSMRVILVGTATERRRLREEAAATPLIVVGEAASTGEARASGVSADALLVATRHETDDVLDYHEELTPRELEVLDLLAQGLSNKAIGDRLGISDQTVKFHVASLSGKLGASNRTSAVRLAIERGLVTL